MLSRRLELLESKISPYTTDAPDIVHELKSQVDTLHSKLEVSRSITNHQSDWQGRLHVKIHLKLKLNSLGDFNFWLSLSLSLSLLDRKFCQSLQTSVKK